MKAPSPLCRVLCGSREDVAKCARFAVEHKLPIVARGSGHQYGGLCLAEGALVVDMSRLKRVEVDVESGTALVEPGVNTLELRNATQPYGLHFPGGHISPVGISGFILGAFLGLVTQFTVSLHPVPAEIPCITAIFPLAAADQVGAFFRPFYEECPQSVEPSMAFTCTSPEDGNKPVVIISCSAFVADCPEIQECYNKLRALLPSKRIVLHDGLLPLGSALGMLDAGWDWPGLCLYGHGMFVATKSLEGEALQQIIQHATDMTSPRSLLLVCPSAPSSTDLHGSSLSYRDCLFVVAYSMWPRTSAGPEADGDVAHAAWVSSAREALQPVVLGCYMNEVMHDRPGQIESCYSQATLAGLRQLKLKVDPHGLLRPLR
ncbi:MAG: hypothetical protein WDW38_010888 [Sanguina aurantia]